MAATSPMLADIERQPTLLAQFADRAEGFAALGRRVLAPAQGGRVWATGCGDGLFAAQAVAGFARARGLDWRWIGALDLVLESERLTPADRVVAISMSGNVDRTVEAAHAVAAANVPLLALVNGKGGRLGEIAQAKISLDLPDLAPFLCGTSSYTLTMAALSALVAGATMPDFAAVAHAQARILAPSKAAIGAIAPPTGVRFLSAGADMGTAHYAAAKFVELTRIPAWAGDLEEFAHSQYWAMPTGDLVVAIALEPRLAAYANESCAALGEPGVACLAIESASAPIAAARHRIAVPEIDMRLAPLVAAVPLQLLAHSMARATGLDPDTRAHLKSDALRFRVSRQLTRRTLLGTGA